MKKDVWLAMTKVCKQGRDDSVTTTLNTPLPHKDPSPTAPITCHSCKAHNKMLLPRGNCFKGGWVS